jgi:hypothetical protein
VKEAGALPFGVPRYVPVADIVAPVQSLQMQDNDRRGLERHKKGVGGINFGLGDEELLVAGRKVAADDDPGREARAIGRDSRGKKQCRQRFPRC